MTILTGSHIAAEAYALRTTKVLVLPRHEVSRLISNNSAVREFVSSRAVEQLMQVEELKHLPNHALATLAARCSYEKFEQGLALPYMFV